MCTQVCIDGDWCETRHEMRRALKVPSGFQFVRDPLYRVEPEETDCLCGTDIRESANRASQCLERPLKVEQDTFGDFHITTE